MGKIGRDEIRQGAPKVVKEVKQGTAKPIKPRIEPPRGGKTSSQ